MSVNEILSIVQIVICVIIVALVMMQESPKGQSGALTGAGDSDTHYEKIKGRTGAATLKKVTVAFAVVFALLTLAINIF